ncbi:hypothetical protein N658DRAFT_488474 [Parathielavia hyrcaniae]|uniref:Uncharacterized protein n=1 Tax=Parathielavia hyrcaniae TaxID=113614 RepID=A0AAN6PUY3_9PEZI|nr:hypothetical protein N658DRAFT_488474 [Parathielavia hyrcaniae]
MAIGVKQGYLGCITASICWFCFLFNIRLVMHMWTNRSILPSLKGLKAMDVLVITNGMLMFVPAWFGTGPGIDTGSPSANSTGLSCSSSSPSQCHHTHHHGHNHHGGGGGGGGSTATTTSKRSLLMGMRRGSSRSGSRRDDGGGIHRGGHGLGAVSTHIAAAADPSEGGSDLSEKGRVVHAGGGDHDHDDGVEQQQRHRDLGNIE